MENFYDDVSEPVAPVIAGDYGDDDAKYEDLLFEESDPPIPSELPREEDDVKNVKIVIPNRLVTRSYQFTGPLARPYQIVPADVNRIRLIVGFSDIAYFASDPGYVPANPPQTANFWDPIYGFATLNYGSPVEIVGYTGPLWCMTKPNIGAAGTLLVTVTSITE